MIISDMAFLMIWTDFYGTISREKGWEALVWIIRQTKQIWNKALKKIIQFYRKVFWNVLLKQCQNKHRFFSLAQRRKPKQEWNQTAGLLMQQASENWGSSSSFSSAWPSQIVASCSLAIKYWSFSYVYYLDTIYSCHCSCHRYWLCQWNSVWMLAGNESAVRLVHVYLPPGLAI